MVPNILNLSSYSVENVHQTPHHYHVYAETVRPCVMSDTLESEHRRLR